MPICFVIQPFDAGKFDKRFDDVYTHAIKAAGLEPYRIDRDPRVDILIEGIENGIRNAAICLADITTDNPNVWYELGYAFAVGRPVVMVCSQERTTQKYPFDIQHRVVINYKSEAPSDFNELQTILTTKIMALLDKVDALGQIAESEQVAPTQGMSQPELIVLAILAGDAGLPGIGTSLWSLKKDAERSGLTSIGFSLAFRRLIAKDLIKSFEANGQNDEVYDAACLTDNGWSWIERNESLFILRKFAHSEIDGLKLEEEIPF